MRCEDTVIDMGLALLLACALHFEHFLILQQAHHIDHVLGCQSDIRQVLRAQPIGFQFHVAPVTGHQRGTRIICQPCEIAAAGKDSHCRRTDIAERRLGLAFHRVASVDVADFMADHGHQLGFRIQKIHDAARDVDVAAAGRECVDVLAVEHRKGVLQVRTLADFGRALTDFVHVLLQLLIVVNTAELLQHERMDFASFGDLAFFR